MCIFVIVVCLKLGFWVITTFLLVFHWQKRWDWQTTKSRVSMWPLNTTFYRRFVIWQRNHFTEMQMGYKVLFVMLLNAKATLVYTGHVSKQDPFDFVWSNHYKEPLRCQHILLKYSDVLQQPANGLPCEWLCRLKGNLHPHIKCTYFTGYLDSSYKLPVMGDVKHLPSLDYNGNNWYRMWCFVLFFLRKNCSFMQ